MMIMQTGICLQVPVFFVGKQNYTIRKNNGLG